MLKYIPIILLIFQSLEKENVYFTKNITSSNIVKIFKKLNVSLKGNIGLKIHTGENGGKYFLSPDFLQEIYDYTNGTFIECNTAYRGNRHSTDLHKELLEINGWKKNNRRIVIMDEDPNSDFNLTITNYEMISENIVGSHLNDFDSCLVLSHLKGHSMGGFGGALKQLSIGFASQAGKAWIHSAGVTTKWEEAFTKGTSQENFTAAMGDAAASIVEYFRNKGGIAFINVMANISKSCDCAGARAPPPKIHDIGILASTDPIALDRACLDLINKNQDTGTDDWLNQLHRLKGENTIFIGEKHKIGSQEYNFIDIDDTNDKDDKNKNTDKASNTDDKKNEGNNYTALIVILSLLFIIIIIGGIIWYIKYKNRKNQNMEIDKLMNEKNI